ncbi:hypothetical protein X737_15840 [Mesorhizobium sp. L48C026A00]|nr:hypothetical protein X737_15840 [Mesorhizobium sp. L48C026A00]
MTFMTYFSPGSHLNGLAAWAAAWLAPNTVVAAAEMASMLKNLRKSPPSAEAWSIGRSDTCVPPLVVDEAEPPPEAQRLIIRSSWLECQ